MASNSFALKGWTVTLVAGIFALASKDADKMYFRGLWDKEKVLGELR